MKTINFDLSCFKMEFQEFIFKKTECNDYFEFINKFENNFILNLKLLENEKEIPFIEDDPQSCTFKNLVSYTIEDSTLVSPEQIEKQVEQLEKIVDSNIEDNIEKIVAEINSEDSDEDTDDKTDLAFSHYIENDQIYVTPSKKFISKRLGKTIKKNGGYWVKQKNLWIFPLSAKHYVEYTLNSQANNSQIKNIQQEKDKVVIIPKIEHPKYGSPTIYDKTGNLGIWDNMIKGWVFQKKN